MSEQEINDPFVKSTREWVEKNGLLCRYEPELDVEYLLSRDYFNSSANEILQIIERASAYNIYLKSLKSSMLAKIAQLEYELKQERFDLIYKIKDRFEMTQDEKEAACMKIDPQLKAKSDKLTSYRMRYYKIKDIPQSIDSHIDILKTIYFKKRKEENA